MVKSFWVAVALVCGIALGVVGARLMRGGDGNRVTFAPDPELATAVSGKTPANATAAVAAVEVSDRTTRASLDETPAAASGAGESPAIGRDETTPQSPEPAPAAHAVVTQRIEVGDAFHQLIDRPSLPGFPNEFGDAHRTLESETRDDSWGPQLEAEIQNSLVAFTSVGEVEVRFLECRTTICELRLYVSEAHPNVINTLQEVLPSQPWMRRVEQLGASFQGFKGGSEALWIFRKASR